MGDRAPCHLVIGGKLPAPKLPQLLQLIDAYDLRTEIDGEPFDASHIEPGAPIDLQGTELNGGCATDLENFCIEHKLPYWRWSGACLGAYEAAIVIFDNPDEDYRSYLALESEQPVAALSELEKFTSLEDVAAFVARASFDPPPFEVVPETPVSRYDPETTAYLAEARRNALTSFPLSRVTADFHDQMLHCLPPVHRRGIPGFFVSEAQTESVHAQFVKHQGQHYGAFVDVTLDPTDPEGPITIAKIDAWRANPDNADGRPALTWFPNP